MKEKTKPFIALVWIGAYLIFIDIAINIVFPYPKDPHDISPSGITQFFEYGRSIEGKLARMTRRTEAESSPILGAGWLLEPHIKIFSNVPAGADKLIVTVYGMSHSVQLAEDMAKIDKSLAVRSFGAPGAVPTWSYAAYSFDREQQHSDVVILAIMTRGVPQICTTSGATSRFDSIWPSTYPRFFLSNGALDYVLPPFISIKGYLEYFHDSEIWKSYLGWLQKYDKYYDPLLFHRTFLDNSSLMRMLRRAYAYSSQRKKDAKVYDDRNGYNINSEEVKILVSIIENFSEDARHNNSLPIIYIVNNVFMSDRLYKLVETTLSAHKILFLSSHEICPPNDPRNYLPDSHFIPSKNLELARAMTEIIRKNLSPKSASRLFQ